jgi:hypothetical protein
MNVICEDRDLRRATNINLLSQIQGNAKNAIFVNFITAVSRRPL